MKEWAEGDAGRRDGRGYGGGGGERGGGEEGGGANGSAGGKQVLGEGKFDLS